MVVLVAPVSADVRAALPSALATLAAEPSSRVLRRRTTDRGSWGHLDAGDRAAVDAAARRSVVVHPPGIDPAELGLLAHRSGYPGLSMVIHLSGPVMAVMLPHDLYDGSSGWFLAERLFQHAAGEATRPVPPVQRFPVLTALRHSGLLSRGALDDVRRARRAALDSTETPPLVDHDVLPDDDRRRDGLRSVWLEDARLAGLAGPHAPGAETARDGSVRVGRTAVTMRLSSLVVDAARQILPAEQDVRVRMAIDLRRYAPRDRSIEGPFSTSYPLGTLRTIDTEPAALGVNAAAAMASKGPLGGFVADMAGYLRARARYPRGLPAMTPGRRSFDLVVSTLPSRFPPGFWEGAGERLVAPLLYHPVQPTDPYVQVAHVRGGVVVSLWDETGLTDRDAFAPALHRLLAERWPVG